MIVVLTSKLTTQLGVILTSKNDHLINSFGIRHSNIQITLKGIKMTELEKAIDLVSKFLEASMEPNPELAATYMDDDVKIIFTGRREMANAQQITAFNKSRYEWVKKSIKQYDAMQKEDHCVVYSIGFLYGQWQDGTPFNGNRYTDRFEVRQGKITKMDVLNDSAEWILTPEINREAE